MTSPFSRRSFLKRGVLAAGAFSASSLLPIPNILAEPNPGRKLNIVQIGCGARGLGAHIDWVLTQSKDNVVAVVDADEKRFGEIRRYADRKGAKVDKLQTFTDYRRMFDKIGKHIDAVFVATPNHHHALASMLAMNLDKAVYCEKPLTHDIAEARKLREMAAKSKAPTQMGNQGHCGEGYRRLCEFIWGGVVGNIIETHSWTNRANGGEGPRPPKLPVPAGLHWEQWLGPAPYRDFHEHLHPHDWHNWFDFGNGSLGNMGCHVLDGVFWALKVEHPTSMEAEFIRGGTGEQYPLGAKLRWDIPARGDMPPAKVYWYEGIKKGAHPTEFGKNKVILGGARMFPDLLYELQKKYPDEEMDHPSRDCGTIYVGEKGYLYTQTYGSGMHILPLEKMNEIKQPPKTLPRPKNIMIDFLDAVREGKKQTHASFDYGARLTEFVLLGNLAQHVGVGNKVEWDGNKMQVTNLKELNKWVKMPYRKGWKA